MNKIKYFFTSIEDGNLAYHTDDKKENVDKNRKLLAKKWAYDDSKLIYMQQVHGNNVQMVDKNSPNLIKNCDGIITKEKNLPLMVMVADCITILFMDKTKGVISAVHAGRKSTFLKIVEITVNKMIEKFSCNTKDIKVVMGASIQKCCYEVSDDIRIFVKENFGEEFICKKNIDLQGINKKILNDLGVLNIEISNICTRCSNKPYFSYRMDKNCGRFAGIIQNS